jgi:integrase
MKIFQFLIQNKKKEAEANIYVRMRVGRKIDIKQRTMFFVPVKNWDDKMGVVKNAKTSELKELVVALSNVRLRLENAYLKAELSQEKIDKLWLSNVLHREQQKEGALPETLIEYFDYYITVKKSTAAVQSIKKWSSVRQKILAYEVDRNYTVQIKDVNEKFRIDFEDYCKSKEKLSANYFERVLSFIKTICKHAGQNDLDISPQLHGLKAKKETVHNIYFTREEIELIHRTPMPSEELENSKDWLIISCNTAQRISDFMHFTNDDLVDMVTGIECIKAIKIKQQKTGRLLEIPIFKMVKEIMDKRGGNFPVSISDQRYNVNIKKVCKIVGLNQLVFGSKMDKKTKRLIKGQFPKWELVTSHIGRRTFATCQFGHLPNTHIMAYTGHTTEKQLLAYIGKPQNEVAKLSIQTLMNNGWI